jgi:hypothetical protein
MENEILDSKNLLLDKKEKVIIKEEKIEEKKDKINDNKFIEWDKEYKIILNNSRIIEFLTDLIYNTD